jgi:macrolide transport system ATP-binding/permease protein
VIKTFRRTWRRLVGCLTGHRQEYHHQRGFPWFQTLCRDMRYAFRGIRRNPGFAAVAVASLALGIGANTAIFSVANAVILRSLPVRNPEQLVLFSYEAKGDISRVQRSKVGDDPITFPYQVYDAFCRRTGSLSDVVAFVPLGMNQQSLTVQTGDQTIVAGGEMVSGNFFRVLGVSPILGRAILEDDADPAAANTAVISHQFWRREFGGSASANGASITVNGLPFTVVGVMPPDFLGLNPAAPVDLWISLRDLRGIKPWGRLRPGPGGLSPFADKGYWWCHIVARLKPGVSREQMQAEADLLFRETLTAGVGQPDGAGPIPHLTFTSAGRGLENLRRSLSEPIWILMAAVALVLLVACCNVTTLLLARAKVRERELAIRVELGARRSRLVCQLLSESIVLSACGGAAGLLLAWWTSAPLARLFTVRQPIPLDVSPDLTVLAFAAAVSLLTGTLIGLVPAFRSTRENVRPQLSASAGRSSPSFTLSRIMIGTQAALAVLLLFAAGLFVRTLQNLDGQDLGFRRANLLLFEIDPRRAGATPDRTLEIYDRALESVQNMPGVRSASLSATALLAGNTDAGPVAVDGPLSPQPEEVSFNLVGPDFLETIGLELLSGRKIDWRDVRERHNVAIINQTMARKLFENQEPIGRRFSFEVPFDPRTSYEVIGVARNAKYDGLRMDPPSTAYLAYGAQGHRLARMCFAIRTAGDPLAILPGVQETIREIDRALPLIDIRTQSDQIARALEQERMFAGLSSLFGGLALLLVAVGLYGTLGYSVLQRTGEIGIRVALGATPMRVLSMVMRESLLLAGCGLAVGLPVALGLANLVTSRLYGVAAHDGMTVLSTAMVVFLTAALAGFCPASRASRIDPLRAIRHD